MNRQQQRTAALAAILQPAEMVHTIARTGTCDPRLFADTIPALFGNGPDAVALYGGEIRRLHRGLHLLERLFSGGLDTHDAKPILTYAANLIALEKQLHHHPDVLARIADGLARIRKQADYFDDMTHNSVVAAIAELYGETISHLKPRIIVRGKGEHLRVAENTQRVRTLLLVALRGAHCWHRAGGNHLRMLLGRKALLREARQLLRTTI